ncbi:hypothetical protein GCM10009589_00930 [Arthrobacter pascens]
MEYHWVRRLVTGKLDPDLIVILPSAKRQVTRAYSYLNSLLACKDDNLGVKCGASCNKADAVRVPRMSHRPRIRCPDVSICDDGHSRTRGQTGAKDLGLEEGKINVKRQEKGLSRLHLPSPFLLEKHRKRVWNLLIITRQVPQLLDR